MASQIITPRRGNVNAGRGWYTRSVMDDRREGLRQFIRRPVMGLILLACIAGGALIGFWIEPVVGWLCVGVFAAGLVVRLVRWIAARRKAD